MLLTSNSLARPVARNRVKLQTFIYTRLIHHWAYDLLQGLADGFLLHERRDKGEGL